MNRYTMGTAANTTIIILSIMLVLGCASEKPAEPTATTIEEHPLLVLKTHTATQPKPEPKQTNRERYMEGGGQVCKSEIDDVPTTLMIKKRIIRIESNSSDKPLTAILDGRLLHIQQHNTKTWIRYELPPLEESGETGYPIIGSGAVYLFKLPTYINNLECEHVKIEDELFKPPNDAEIINLEELKKSTLEVKNQTLF